MSLVHIPQPQPGQLVALAEVEDRCQAVEAWAARSDSVGELRDAGHKLEALDEYLAKTSKVGRARLSVTLRLIETRIGDLLGEATIGSHSSASEGLSLTPNERHDFRQMAAHPDIVDEVTAEATDEQPASRRKVLQRIRQRASQPPTQETLAEAKVNAERQARYDRLLRAVQYLAEFDVEAVSAEIEDFVFTLNIAPLLAPAIEALTLLQTINHERIPQT